ncbi:MAG TPA: co-chaperone GroES [Spirochaetota bacterium]|nr:co-chaperone GroES [Spirochaetota bacterium]HSA13546.1 co-chaperone GroES [Spirochaetota bacterium]
MALKPIADRIIVQIVEPEEERVGSIYVPDTAKEKPQQGKVIAVGSGKRDGKDIIPMTVKAGDIVLFGKYSGAEVKHDGKDYLIISENDVLAIVE